MAIENCAISPLLLWALVAFFPSLPKQGQQTLAWGLCITPAKHFQKAGALGTAKASLPVYLLQGKRTGTRFLQSIELCHAYSRYKHPPNPCGPSGTRLPYRPTWSWC